MAYIFNSLFGLVHLLLQIGPLLAITTHSRFSAEVNAAGLATPSHASLEEATHDSGRNSEDPDPIHGRPAHRWHWVRTANGKDWERRPVTVSSDKEDAQSDAAASTDAVTEAHKSDSKSTKQVHIDVYYETRCPGCMLFINRTLEPLWRNQGLRDSLNITLITYGNAMTIPTAKISEGYKFWHPETTGTGWDTVQICQHGGDECLGNLVQLCAKEVADNSKYMELIFCMAATTIAGYGEEKSTYVCMQQSGIDHQKVRSCVTSPRGNDLAAQAGKVTNMLKNRLGTPWVMVQGAHVQDKLLMNSTLLMQEICTHVDNTPVPCAAFREKKQAAPAKQPASSDDGNDFNVLSQLKPIRVVHEHV